MNDAVVIEAKENHRASVIWLHGLGADGNDFAPVVPELGIADELGVRYIFPHAPRRAVTVNGGMVMRSWYDIKDPDLSKGRDRKDFDASAKILEQYIEAEIESGIPASKIIVAGFSQGGAITLHCGLAYHRQLAGMLVLSSYLPFAEILDDEHSGINHMTPILMAHGEYDPLIPIDFARQSADTLKQRGYDLAWHSFPMQHGVCIEEIKLIGDWLNKQLGD